MPVSTAVARISLASANPPATRTGHSILVRCRTTLGTGAYIRASLYEGATDRTGILEALISTGLTTYRLVIADAAAATIASYANLEVRLWGYQPSGAGLHYEIAAVWLEIPAASSATTVNGSATRALNFNASTNGSVVGSTKTTTVARISLGSATDPGVDSGHVIQVRARAYSGTGSMKAALYQGATNRSGDLQTATLSASLTDNALAIPDASAANITDYSNLEVRFWGVSTAGASFDVASVTLLLPSASGAGATVGLATETSSAMPMVSTTGIPPIYPGVGIYPSDQTAPGSVLVGIAIETSSAFALAATGSATVVTIGIAIETDTAPALALPVAVAVTIATETSSAFATAFLGGSQVITLGIAIESNLTGRTTGSGDIITRSVIKDGDVDLVIGAQLLDPKTLTYTNYFRGAIDELAMLGGMISDREVGDLWSRINHNGTDTVAYNSSTAIWQGATNLIPNGGFEAGISGWSAISGAALSVSSDACLGDGSLQILASGSGQGASLSSSVVTTVSQPHTGSVWVKGSGVVRLELEERTAADAVVGTTNGTSVGLEGTWRRISVSRTFGATGARARLRVIGQSATATILVDGAQLEQQVVATPYIETNGTSAARTSARVQAPASYLDPAQGWVACRVRVGWGNAAEPGLARLLDWRDSSTSFLSLYYDNATNSFVIRRTNNVTPAQASVAQALAPADRCTVIAAWTSAGVKLSVNGAAFVSGSGTGVPALVSTLMDIGSQGGSSEHLNGDVIWLSCGVGTLTDTDARVLYDWNDEPPRLHTYAAAALVRFAWDGVDDYGLEAGYTHPLSTGKLRRIFHKPGAKRGATELELIDDMERLSTEQGFLPRVASGEYMGEAISRILKKIGMVDPSTWDLDDGEPGLTLVTNDGTEPWLNLITDIITSDYGIFLLDAQGRAVFRERRSRPRAPYKGRLSRELHALEPGVDLDRIVNTWVITAGETTDLVQNPPSSAATFQRSYRRYGIRFAERTAKHLVTSDQAYSLAEHLVRRSSEPDAPVYAVSLTNRSDRQLALALSLAIGDMIEVFGKQTIGHYIVEQINAEVDVSSGTHDVALIVSAP